MDDNHLCVMAGLVAACYGIYMIFVGGDGIIFASVVGAICVLAGVKYEHYRIQKELKREGE